MPPKTDQRINRGTKAMALSSILDMAWFRSRLAPLWASFWLLWWSTLLERRGVDSSAFKLVSYQGSRGLFGGVVITTLLCSSFCLPCQIQDIKKLRFSRVMTNIIVAPCMYLCGSLPWMELILVSSYLFVCLFHSCFLQCCPRVCILVEIQRHWRAQNRWAM